MTSVPSISRLLMRAWAPVSCIGVLRFSVRVRWMGDGLEETGRKNPSPGRGVERTDARGRRALGDYEEVGGECCMSRQSCRDAAPRSQVIRRIRLRRWWTGHE